MNAQVSIITLGVRDLGRAKAFYADRLGWPVHAEEGDWVCFILGGGSTAFALYPWDALAEAEQAGGSIVKPARRAEWGGYSGYFADPDGHLWEVATGATKLPVAE